MGGKGAGTEENDAPEPEWLVTNRRLWDEMAALHPDSPLYDVDGLVAGADPLRPSIQCGSPSATTG